MAEQGPLSGQVLGGKYQLGELLGEGGFGMVYAGQHLLLDRPQAIKVLLERYFSRPKFRERFLREARLVAALDHLHIVHIDDFGIEEQAARAYLVMPFIGGGTLQDVLKKRRKPLEMEQVVSYVEQVAQALEYAHQRGVVHLDLKPQNLLVHADGRLLLADFGLAHLLKQEVVEGGSSLRYGTPHYMAPEHINGQPEKRSDVYALGVILYQMLVGRRPFEAATPEAVIVKHLTERPPPLQMLRPELPLELEEVVERALAKEAAQRYQSAGELVVALKGALATEEERRKAEEEARKAQEEERRKAEEERERKAQEKERVRKALEEEARKFQKKEETPFLSRRTVIMGIGRAVGLVTIGGGLLWLGRGHPIPPPISLGTRLYTYHGHSQSVNAVAWSPDGKYIASGSADKTVQVWDVATGNLKVDYKGHSDAVNSVAWSPDGKYIASGGADKTVQVWDAATGNLKVDYKGHSNTVNSVAWSPDGKYIASGSADQTVQVWDATNGGHVFTYQAGATSVSAVWSPDGQRIASGWNSAISPSPSFGCNPNLQQCYPPPPEYRVRVWDATNGSHVYVYGGHSQWVNTVAWSPNGQRIASGSGGDHTLYLEEIDNTVQVWDAANGGHVYVYGGHSSPVNSVAWSPNGRRIASGSADKTAQVWDAVGGGSVAANGGHVYIYRGHTSPVNSVAWSPDGKYIASGSADHTVQVWVAR